MAIAHKGLDAHFRPWRFSDRSLDPSFSRVPVLLHGTETIADSWRIAEYLEKTYPLRPGLFAPAGVELARFVNRWADTLIPAMARVIVLEVYQCLDPADQPYFRASRERFFHDSLEVLVADRPARLAELRTALEPLRQIVKRQAFLHGETPAYADYCAFGLFMWARCCSRVEVLTQGDPIQRWREQLLDVFDGMAKNTITS